MVNSYVRFDIFQQLVLWLSKSMKSYREGRHYLATNTLVITDETDKELTRLISAYDTDQADMRKQLHQHLALLRDVRSHGGTSEAIREAYVNTFGGWALDIPAWLEKIEHDLLFLSKLRRIERTRRTQVRLLQEAINYAEQDERIAPELRAELYNELGSLLLQGPRFHTHKENMRARREAIAYHEAALAVYQITRYPLQYAKTQMLLGAAYHRCAAAGQTWAVEQAIEHYQAALLVYKPGEFPEQWMRLQTSLGNAYTLRSAGDRAENIERAISYHQDALFVLRDDTPPLIPATINFHLGDAYSVRLVGDRTANQEQAIAYYKAAMKILSLQHFPYEWACIHTRLAAIFQQREVADEDERDMYLRCAIVCYEGALEIYRPDAYPVERADIQLRLALTHLMRREGDLQQHREQALRCYRHAMKTYRENAFPQEYRYIQHMIASIEARNVDLQVPASFHAPFNSCIMVKSL